MPLTRSGHSSTAADDDSVEADFHTPHEESAARVVPPVPAAPSASAPPTAPAAAAATVTIGDMSAMMMLWQQSLQRLLDREEERRPATPAPAPAEPITTAHHSGGYFTTCNARYSGAMEESLDGFIDAIEAYKDCANVSDANALRGISMLLTHDAATWWQGVKPSITTWTTAIQSLRSAFGDSRPPHRIYRELFKMTHEHEKTELFIARARALLARLPRGDLSEKVEIDMIYGLLHQRIRERLRREEVYSFEILLWKSREVEDSLDNVSNDSASCATHRPAPSTPRMTSTSAAPSLKNAARRPSTASTSASTSTMSPDFASNNKSAMKSRPFCIYCKVPGHVREECRKLSNKNTTDKIDNDKRDNNTISCYGCGAKGVIRSQCPNCTAKVSFYAVSTFPNQCKPPYSTPSSNNDIHDLSINISCDKICYCDLCYGDDEVMFTYSVPNVIHVSHATNFTPFTQHLTDTNSDTLSLDSQSLSKGLLHDQCLVNHTGKFSPTFEHMHSRANGPNSSSMYSRANVSNCSGVYSRVNVPNSSTDFERMHSRVSGPNFSSMCSRVNVPNFSTGVERVHSRVNGPNSSRTFSRVNGTGVDPNCSSSFESVFSRVYDTVVAPISATSTATYCSRPILCVDILGSRGTALIDTAAKCCVAGHSLFKLLKDKKQSFTQKQVAVKLADGVVHQRDVLVCSVDVSVTFKKKKVPIEFVIFPDADNNETLLGMDFLSASGMVIDFATSCWKFSGSHQTYPLEFESEDSEVPRSVVASSFMLREDEGIMLTCDQRRQVSDVLDRHEDVFNLGGAPTPYAEHRIDTGDHVPVAVPPYRLTPAKKAIMEAELGKMLAEGIIEECESPWASPALLVPKKDGTFRFCVDYRRLNAITKSDSYPLPVIEDLLHSTKGCFISTIDLRSSYWQVSVAPGDRDKTAFVTPFGTYRFLRMPFGLKNAPATFQRLMDRFRSGSMIKDVTLLVYLDDLLVLSESYEKHLQDLQLVFDRLRVFGLRANRDKCVFVAKEVKYLGHLITPEGILPDGSKVESILNMNEPKNLKHLRTFLQTCAWFRKFVPGFSGIAQPLTKLTRKNEPWNWSDEQQKAFDELKKKLTSAPVLVQADYSKPFVIRTDASDYALGAVLTQGDGIEEHPIEYSSRLLTSAERKYSTTEREALAVVWAVEKYRPYIDGHPIIVRSDHQPLRWLLTLKSPSGRLMRWALRLQAFDIQYEYTPGKANVIADTLSRPVCDDVSREDCGICTVIVDVPHVNAEELRKSQLSDPDVCKIIQDLEHSDALASNRWLERGYLMNQGVLYRLSPDADSEEPQLVIPASMIPEVLKEFHDAPLAGHQGVDRTLERIRQRYYFTGMRRYVSEYLKTCVECQKYKPANQKPAGLLQTPILNQRGEVLAVDLFGPLPEAEDGSKWVLLIEDTATRWVEIFALRDATAEACAPLMIEQYFMRYGFPRRIVSDNGVQFVSAVMQQCMHILGIKQNLIPLYHPEANPAERKNRDMKIQLAMLVKTEHRTWSKYLPQVRFALNTATCSTTGLTPSYMMFAREMRTPFDAHHDLRAVLEKDNYVPQVTPYLASVAARKLEDQLKLTLLALKDSKALCEQLLSEREDSEKEVLVILEQNKQLKSEMAALHQRLNDVEGQNDQLQRTVHVFDRSCDEFETALKRTVVLEREVRDAHKQISDFELADSTFKMSRTQSLFDV
ncbi:uncharacterized protein LOC126375782 [Pectinophora gossypiella]|uniref:uncharacterized protein LOC126375782 n=1 Tax=Pectinophora gossypiella TaxID=13191 RepID=UPI00214E5AB6|nr:uncharacterized protein LOC126375782 [Pectinophora gossypiella]